MKKTFNKDNWSGEEMTITINEAKKTFKFYDTTVKVLMKKETDEEMIKLGFGDSFKAFLNDQQLATVTGCFYHGRWTAYDVDSDLTREDRDMYVAIAKVLSNTL